MYQYQLVLLLGAVQFIKNDFFESPAYLLSLHTQKRINHAILSSIRDYST